MKKDIIARIDKDLREATQKIREERVKRGIDKEMPSHRRTSGAIGRLLKKNFDFREEIINGEWDGEGQLK